jgi:anaerobic selenocysteine-containing dehydrogenase
LWWIATRLGEHLGHRLLPGTLDSATATDDDLIDAFCGRGRLPLDELRAAPTAIVAEGPVRGWVHNQVLPDGKWRLAPRVLVEDLARVAALVAAPAPHDPTELTLLPRRLLRTLNSQLRGVAAPGGRLDSPVLLLHPDDAAGRGITDASPVRLSSTNGSVLVVAQLDDNIRRGSVSLPHGFAEPAVGAVTTGHVDTDPLTGMVQQSGLRVRVTPASS